MRSRTANKNARIIMGCFASLLEHEFEYLCRVQVLNGKPIFVTIWFPGTIENKVVIKALQQAQEIYRMVYHPEVKPTNRKGFTGTTVNFISEFQGESK